MQGHQNIRSNGFDDEIDLRDYWRVIQRRQKLLLVIWAGVFLLGTALTFFITPKYLGEATILVEDSRSSKAALLDLTDMGGAVAVETEMELLRSRTVAEKVVRTLALDGITLKSPAGSRVLIKNYESQLFPRVEAPEFTIRLVNGSGYEVHGPNGENLGKGELGRPYRNADKLGWVLELSGPQQSEYRFKLIPFEYAVQDLRERTTVAEVGKKTNIIRIAVEHPDPFLAGDIANRLAESYIDENIARKSLEATQTLEFLEEQLRTLQGSLEEGEKRLDAFKADSGIFILSSTAEKLIEQISRLEIAKADTRLQERQLAATLGALEKAGTNDGPFLVNAAGMPDPTLTKLTEQLSQRLVELRTLRTDFTDENPRVAVMRAQVDELKGKLHAAVVNAKQATDNRLATIANIINGYENQLKRLPQAERELASLTRKSEVNAELYTFLLKKHEEARISRAGIVGNVRLVDAALVPDKPVSPNKKKNIAISFILGLGLAVGIAFIVEYFDQSIKTLDDVERELGLNVYGVIPFVEHPEAQPFSLAGTDPRSPVQEAYRALRTNIQFGSTDRKIQTILCTSALPGVGKTTTTVNLAMSLAQGGARVLIVDCDLRRPQVHRFLSLPLEPGLTNVLGGAKTGEQVIHRSKDFPTLSVATAGTIPPNPAELLAHTRFQDLMNEARKEFDYILIDTPPVIAFTDAVIVAAQMDAVFMVLELGKSSRQLAQRSLELLQNVQARVTGVVVNKQKAADSPEYYYYGNYGYKGD